MSSQKKNDNKKKTFTSKIRSSEPPVGFISVCAEHHQQLVAFGNEGGRLLPATPASQQGVHLTLPVVNGNGVVVALVWQTVAVLQVHDGEEKFDAVPSC